MKSSRPHHKTARNIPDPKAGNQKKARSSGAKPAQSNNLFRSYVENHRKTFRASLQEHLNRPLASFFTCSVIGIAFVLPTLLAIFLINIQSIDIGWDGQAQITLFLHDDISSDAGQALSAKLASQSNISNSTFVNRDQALEDFQSLFELEHIVDYLDANPLPHSILVTPHPSLKSIDHLNDLKKKLEANEQVNSALLDVIWIQRLQSITQFLQRSVLIIGLMLACAVVLILGNTIRLAIENRKEEIIVLKLVGGTDSFVCRPFLYMGVLYGLGGSLVAIILTQGIIIALNNPVRALASSYQSHFDLSGLGFDSTLVLLILGMTLGWLGSWMAVRKHLGDIEPT